MTHKMKKRVLMLALLISAAGAMPARAEEGQVAEQAVAGKVEPESGEVAAAAAPADGTEPATTTGAAASESATAPDAGGNEPAETGAIETLPPSYNPFNWLVYKPLWALSRAVGDFNPIGKYVSEPIESAVPGLRVKGFINSITQINTTSDNHDVGLGHRDKDWRLQKQEFRTQLELKYQANDNIEFVNVNNFQYDGVYDFQDSNGLFLDGSSNQKNYSQGKRIIREAYVRGNYGKINFTLGKQIVNWGKMDGKVIDIVNAADGRDVVDFHIGDYEWRAIGQWMAYLSVRPTETATVSLLVNPDFQPNVGPAAGSPWFFPFVNAPQGTKPTPEKRPSGFDRVQDTELGIRGDTTIGALSLSGIYYYGFDRDPVFFSSDKVLHHTRVNRFGYALDYGTSILGQRLIVRSEGLYTSGKAFNTSDTTAPDGVVKKDTVKLAVAFETSIFSDENKIDILYQPIWTRQLGFDKRTGAVRNDLLHVVNLGHSFRSTGDKLSLSTTGYISGGSVYSGLSYNVSAGWRFNDYLKATLAYNDYLGKDDDIPWGAYRKWKNVTVDVKYEF